MFDADELEQAVDDSRAAHEREPAHAQQRPVARGQQDAHADQVHEGELAQIHHQQGGGVAFQAIELVFQERRCSEIELALERDAIPTGSVRDPDLERE
jgi:hypothetical protein